MRRIRVIPVMTIDKTKLVKTIRFSKPNYIGDPVNSIKLFNDKQVDEIAVLDITASTSKREPSFALIKQMAEECFIPMSYGGGITSLDQAKRLFDSGIEKVILNSVVAENPKLIEEIAHVYGNQSVVVCLDIKKSWLGKYTLYHFSGQKKSGLSIEEFLKNVTSMGAGEILVQNMDKDGTFGGYDYALINQISSQVNIPVVACGGAQSLLDMKQAVIKGGASAVAAGSFFVYMNNNPSSILVNYPTQKELISEIFSSL